MLNINITDKPGFVQHWQGLYGASRSLALAEAASTSRRPILVITPDTLTQNQIKQELEFFTHAQNIPLITFPDHETLPYDHFSPHQDIVSERLATLYKLPGLKQGIVLVNIGTLLQRLPPKHYITSNSLCLTSGQELDLDILRNDLINSGYYHVQQVMEHGEFTIRGSIIDLYPMGSPRPFRIDLFDNEIDSIRTFDPETQRSYDTITEIRLLPARECPLNQQAQERFQEQWSTFFSIPGENTSIYQSVMQGQSFAGIDYYLPLLFNETATLFNYLAPNTLIIRPKNLPTVAANFWLEINERYEQLRYDISHPILPPKELFTPEDQLFAQLKSYPQIEIHPNVRDDISDASTCFNFVKLPDTAVNNKSKPALKKLQQFIIATDKSTLFCAESAGRKEALLDLLKEISIKPIAIKNWQEYKTQLPEYAITISQLEQGCANDNIIIITETEIFGQHVNQRRAQKEQTQDPDSIIKDLTELHVGDPIVHIQHGIGKYIGLQTIETANQIADYLTIEYANATKLYVPVASLHLVSRYLGAGSDNIQYNQLGTAQWQKAKKKAAEKIRDVAAELLEIHAKRAANTGYALVSDKQQYQLFANSFPFETTPDQQRAIDDVLDDMRSTKAMERLVCGDVGFGKTEVAMRAAFVATQNNKQVAMLVPTTLLTQQHYENFRDRFADWPINIAMLSRFNSSKEQKEILEKLTNGQVDIVIGTHKLIQKDIKFKNLGLLIIDEEHRFGVKQKEKIKSLRAHIDILALTATPIPRTLSMALANISDLSIIASPPERRLAIKTFIKERNNQLLREAVLREIWRGGQIYFLHNDIATITAIAHELSELIPEAKVNIAHGQMRERQLEHIMNDFYHMRFNLLVCTTIIESGIDIPTANTIIINRADKFGLAQLHQLRGRVGRSHHQAYAYLIVPSHDSLTRDAKKRLEAIEYMEDLGAGFMLATHDLEIRGAGEILGEEQSGQIQTIGYNLYMELLEKAVKTLQSGGELDLDETEQPGTEIDLAIPALLPDTYVPNVNTRLTIYKRISNAKKSSQLHDLKIEFIDRFGLLPDATKNLFAVTELKLQAEKLGIKTIKVGPAQGHIEFQDKPNVTPERVISLIRKHPITYQFASATKLRFKIHDNTPSKKIQAVREILNHFST